MESPDTPERFSQLQPARTGPLGQLPQQLLIRRRQLRTVRTVL